ncbi:UNVERIFIED_CONTAM: hypothetical protein PYX00_003679 [Menopon gallinae]|uniref:Ribosomal protein S16 n=1 Tax=Menopon gallinae TaxID=328185 RepID=A0AAW2I2G8_9NEOP
MPKRAEKLCPCQLTSTPSGVIKLRFYTIIDKCFLPSRLKKCGPYRNQLGQARPPKQIRRLKYSRRIVIAYVRIT